VHRRIYSGFYSWREEFTGGGSRNFLKWGSEAVGLGDFGPQKLKQKM